VKCARAKRIRHLNAMEEIWKDLPYDMVREILSRVDDIDVRIKFKIKPRKIKRDSITLNDGIIYNSETKSLHIFSNPQFHIVRRPIEFNFMVHGITYFNLDRNPHTIETTFSNGANLVLPGETESFATKSRILVR